MIIEVKRFYDNNESTLGLISIDGQFECFSLEDTFRMNKVAGKSRIPAGVYPLVLREAGGMHNRYKKRFPRFHKGMLWIKNIPNFKFVYFHIGNRHQNTKGCVLTANMALKNGTVLQSTDAYTEFYKKVCDGVINGKWSYVIIRDEERVKIK